MSYNGSKTNIQKRVQKQLNENGSGITITRMEDSLVTPKRRLFLLHIIWKDHV